MQTSLYELGDTPPVGTVPRRMYAAVIRPGRYGPPSKAIEIEVVDVPEVGPDQVLVYVMAAGVNYNNVWAGMGKPLDVIAARRRAGAPEDYHIGGSDGSGVVWAVGERVRGVRPGDSVVMSGGQWDESDPDIRAGLDPTLSETLRIWGYQESFGTFAQFALVSEYQCHPKPARLSWADAAAFMTSGATAYRQLTGWHPNVVRPGDPVLIWGGAGGLGSMAIQIVALYGGIPVAVVSNDDRAEYCMRLGARGVIDRREFDHWDAPSADGGVLANADWVRQVRRFRDRFWDIVGDRRLPSIVFEHSGANTIPTSMYLCDRGGMIVLCGATTGYTVDVDLRVLWMNQKRLQGSHFANTRQCREITSLIASGRIDPAVSRVWEFEDIAEAHQAIHDNNHPPGNMAVSVNANDRT